MGEIKPIETYYNGYRFRSRLEARWAVFFDSLGIVYEYEPQGFNIGHNERYLPDFYLPNLNYYIEVKGKNNHMLADMDKIEKFIMKNKTIVMILGNIPYNYKAGGLYWFPILYYSALGGGLIENCYAFFLAERETGYGYIQDDFYIGRSKRFVYKNMSQNEDPNEHVYNAIQSIHGDVLDEDDEPTIKSSLDEELFLVETAMMKARQARFEHGETPQPIMAIEIIKDDPFFEIPDLSKDIPF